MPTDYEGVRGFLLTNVPGFADSIEYDTLNEVETELTGIVCAAFSRFLARFQDAERREGVLSDRDARTLEGAYISLEQLARSPNLDVRTVLKHEVFENLDCDSQCMTLIRSRLGPCARELFDEVWGRPSDRC